MSIKRKEFSKKKIESIISDKYIRNNKFELIDAHAHLIWPELISDIKNIMKRAEKNGVSYVINTGIKIEDFTPCLELGENFKNIFNTIGIHPEEAIDPKEKFEDFKQKFIENQKNFIAIGEIGMDFFQVKDPNLRKIQEKVFRQQLNLAVELQKPVLIHCRWAEKHSIRILEESIYSEIPGVVLHCFAGAKKYIMKALDHDNWIFTVPTSVVYSNQHQKLTKIMPLERIMLETDSPFLKPLKKFPVNEPKNIIFSARKIAEIKNTTFKEVAKQTTLNCRKFFDF